MKESLNQLIQEYTDWLTTNGYASLSADELLHEIINTDKQDDINYLKLFITRWEGLTYEEIIGGK